MSAQVVAGICPKCRRELYLDDRLDDAGDIVWTIPRHAIGLVRTPRGEYRAPRFGELHLVENVTCDGSGHQVAPL